jgi:peptidoglycan/LPS O-acetylase OafA/YrhL
VATILQRLTFRSSLSHSRLYRADIDGLRALAVLPVVFFHAGIPGFSGGFVGVDVFYTISGYLITSIIIRDLSLGRFSIASFYERRIRRIFPALFTVVLFTLLAAAILLTPAELLALGKSLIAMTFFSSNIYFKHQGGTGGYFDNDASSLPLLHTWSLSVEEQYYVFFPAALILLTRHAEQRRGILLSVAAAASFAIGLWQTQHQPLSAFYLLIPRAWELLIGAILALKVIPPLQSRDANNVIGVAGLGLLILAVSTFDRTTPFPGAAAVVPCLGAALVIHASECGPSLSGRILSIGPLVFIGMISYSLYLWHWPILVLAKDFRAGPLSNSDIAAVVTSSVLLAFLSFEFVESPFRGGQSRFGRRQVFCLGMAACVLSAIAGLVIYWSRGLPQRFSESTKQEIAENSERQADYLDACSNWKKEIRSETDINFCRLGTQSSRTIMFWGDSHVQQLYPLIQHIFDQGGLYGQNAIFAIDEGCALAEHLNRPDPGFHCDSFAKYAMARAEQSDVDVVFIGFAAPPARILCPSINGRCIGNISTEEADSRLLQELSTYIHRLRTLGKRVIVSLPFPLYDKSIPELQVRNAILRAWGSVETATDRTLPSTRDKIASVAVGSGAELFDPRRSLCSAKGCITEVAGVSIYRDFSHLAKSQIGILEADMKSTLRRVIGIAGGATSSEKSQ